MIGPEFTAMEQEFLSEFRRYARMTLSDSSPHNLTVQSVTTGEKASFNFVTMVQGPDYFFKDAPVTPGNTVADLETFLDMLPEPLVTLYSNSCLREAVNILRTEFRCDFRYIVSDVNGWWISSPHLLVLIVKEVQDAVA